MAGIFRRALADTIKGAGGKAGIVFLIAGPLVGWAILGGLYGKPIMDAEAQYLLTGLAGVSTVFLLMLAYNLITAPYRMQRERADAAERGQEDRVATLQAHIGDLKEQLATSQSPKTRMRNILESVDPDILRRIDAREPALYLVLSEARLNQLYEVCDTRTGHQLCRIEVRGQDIAGHGNIIGPGNPIRDSTVHGIAHHVTFVPYASLIT